MRYDCRMTPLKWSTSHAVWVTEIDDEHKEIFVAVGELQSLLTGSARLPQIRKMLGRLTTAAADHFAHEERLMHASRYPGLRWHKRQHDAARRKAEEFAAAIEAGDKEAGLAMVEYLTGWLRDHTRVADRMMGAHLRNQARCVGKLTFRAGTKPANACSWVDSTGNRFDPLATATRL